MQTIEKSIELAVPIEVVYNQWTQFEDFPKFMEGIQEVRQIDDKRVHWKAKIAGQEKEWDTEIDQQIADQVISWHSTSGASNIGRVRFDKAPGGKTRLTLELGYEPEGAVEKVGDALGVFSLRVQGDLNRFKEFIEKRGQETGGWRGEISGDGGAARM
ncbi:MAG: SRPBCC family protein [Rhodospirillales bacterium]|nr:SRPBCC family protein [Acetobacter sp.]